MSDNVIELKPKRVPKYEKVDSGLFRNRETGVYYVRKTFKHLRIPNLFESLKTQKLNVAKREMMRKIDEHKLRYLGGRTVTDRDQRAGKTIGAIIEEMLITVTPKGRKGTQLNHQRFFRELGEHWGQMDVNRLTLVMWERWLADFKRQKKKRKTFDDYVKWMNKILNYAKKHRYLKESLALEPTDPKKVTGRVYTHEQLAALWSVMNEDMRDQFVLAFECFLRLREALYLTWERIDLETGELVLRAEDVKTGSKTGKGRTIIVSPSCLERLQARRVRMKAKDSPYVFPSPENPDVPQERNQSAWRNAKKNVNEIKGGVRIVGKARWHDIRHTSLTMALLEKQMNPVVVSEYAGVSLRTIQKVYLHSTSEKTKSVSMALSINTLLSDSKGVTKV